jgi:hypothetical protein
VLPARLTVSGQLDADHHHYFRYGSCGMTCLSGRLYRVAVHQPGLGVAEGMTQDIGASCANLPVDVRHVSLDRSDAHD